MRRTGTPTQVSFSPLLASEFHSDASYESGSGLVLHRPLRMVPKCSAGVSNVLFIARIIEQGRLSRLVKAWTRPKAMEVVIHRKMLSLYKPESICDII